MPTRNRRGAAPEADYSMNSDACPQPETAAQFRAAIDNFDIQRLCRILYPKSAHSKVLQAVSDLQNNNNVSILLSPNTPAVSHDLVAVIQANNDEPGQLARSSIEAQITTDEQAFIKSLSNVAKEIAGLCIEEYNQIFPAKNLSSQKISVKLLLPTDVAGFCIGKKGESIKGLRSISACEDIKVYTPNCPKSKDRVMEMNGTPEAVYSTLTSVLIKMRCYTMQVEYSMDDFYNPENKMPGSVRPHDRNYGGYAADDFEKSPAKSPAKSSFANRFPIENETKIVDSCQPVVASMNPVAQEQTLRVLVRHFVGGRIIGKKGATISHLRTFYDMDVKCRDSGTDDRILELKSRNHSDNRQAIITALSAIMAGIAGDQVEAAEAMHYAIKKEEPNATEIRLLVDSSACGGVVGKSGASINILRDTHSCLVKLYSDRCPNSSERVIAISGSPQNLLNCVYDVMGLVNDHSEKPTDYVAQKPVYAGEFDHSRKSVESCRDYGGYIQTYENPMAPLTSPSPANKNDDKGRKRTFSNVNNSVNKMPGWGMPTQPQTMVQMFPQQQMMAQSMAQPMMPQQNMAPNMMSQQAMASQNFANMMSQFTPNNTAQFTQNNTAQFSAAPNAQIQSQNTAPPKQAKMNQNNTWKTCDNTQTMAQAMGLTQEMYNEFKKKMMGEMFSSMMGGK